MGGRCPSGTCWRCAAASGWSPSSPCCCASGSRRSCASAGEAQRICLARQLACEPEILLLDEPTAALDRASAAAIERALRWLLGDGRTVVMVSHDLAQTRRLADHVLLLEGGRLVDQGPPAIIGDPRFEVRT